MSNTHTHTLTHSNTHTQADLGLGLRRIDDISGTYTNSEHGRRRRCGPANAEPC